MTETTRRALPRYTSFKTVEALLISKVEDNTLHFVNSADYPSRTMPERWIKRHEPRRGGYYVRYPDGYESYSPAHAFESGYIYKPDVGPFDLVELHADQVEQIQRIKDVATTMHSMLAFAPDRGNPRLLAMARSQLELAVMCATKAIARRDLDG